MLLPVSFMIRSNVTPRYLLPIYKSRENVLFFMQVYDYIW